MAQYIDKDSLVAEIERRIDELYDLLPNASKVEDGSITMSEACNTGKYTALESFRSFLDTLEAKEVDLEKAIDDYIYTHDGRKRLALELDWKCCNLTLKGGDEIIKFAKHFFELGMAVSNPPTWEDINSILYIERLVLREFGGQEHSNEELCREVLKRFKAQKGEKVC